MNHNDYRRLHEIVVRLDRLRPVPTEVLAEIVRRGCVCQWVLVTEVDPLEPTTKETADRELAEQLCIGCTAHDACLELELRLYGEETIGVWGGLSEQDRRALHLIWLAHRQNLEHGDTDEAGDV